MNELDELVASLEDDERRGLELLNSLHPRGSWERMPRERHGVPGLLDRGFLEHSGHVVFGYYRLTPIGLLVATALAEVQVVERALDKPFVPAFLRPPPEWGSLLSAGLEGLTWQTGTNRTIKI